MLWLVLLVVIAVGFYLLFKDTLNKIQYIQTFRIYWITRDDGVLGTPVVMRAFMRQTAPPWWRGTGIQLRYKTYTFQFGVLTGRGTSLLDQLGGRELEESAKEIRRWGLREDSKRD